MLIFRYYLHIHKICTHNIEHLPFAKCAVSSLNAAAALLTSAMAASNSGVTVTLDIDKLLDREGAAATDDGGTNAMAEGARQRQVVTTEMMDFMMVAFTRR